MMFNFRPPFRSYILKGRWTDNTEANQENICLQKQKIVCISIYFKYFSIRKRVDLLEDKRGVSGDHSLPDQQYPITLS